MSSAPQPKPMGWLVGLAVLLITLGVVCGLVGIAWVAKRKQRYRINDEGIPARFTNAPSASSGRAPAPGGAQHR